MAKCLNTFVAHCSLMSFSGVWKTRIANNDEQSRVVANRSKRGTQNLGVNLEATWNRIFPLKSIDVYLISGQKVFLNLIS